MKGHGKEPSQQSLNYVHPLQLSVTNLGAMWPELPSARLRAESYSNLVIPNGAKRPVNSNNAANSNPIKENFGKRTGASYSKDDLNSKSRRNDSFMAESKSGLDLCYYNQGSENDLSNEPSSGEELESTEIEHRRTLSAASSMHQISTKYTCASTKHFYEIRPLNASNSDLTSSGSLASMRGSFKPKLMLKSTRIRQLRPRKHSSSSVADENNNNSSEYGASSGILSASTSPQISASIQTGADKISPVSVEHMKQNSIHSVTSLLKHYNSVDAIDQSESAVLCLVQPEFSCDEKSASEKMPISNVCAPPSTGFQNKLIADSLTEGDSQQWSSSLLPIPQLDFSTTSSKPAVDSSIPCSLSQTATTSERNHAVVAGSPSIVKKKAKLLEQILSGSNTDQQLSISEYQTPIGSNTSTADNTCKDITDSSVFVQKQLSIAGPKHIYGAMPLDYYKKKRERNADQSAQALSSNASSTQVPPPTEAVRKLALALADKKKRAPEPPLPTDTAVENAAVELPKSYAEALSNRNSTIAGGPSGKGYPKGDNIPSADSKTDTPAIVFAAKNRSSSSRPKSYASVLSQNIPVNDSGLGRISSPPSAKNLHLLAHSRQASESSKRHTTSANKRLSTSSVDRLKRTSAAPSSRRHSHVHQRQPSSSSPKKAVSNPNIKPQPQIPAGKPREKFSNIKVKTLKGQKDLTNIIQKAQSSDSPILKERDERQQQHFSHAEMLAVKSAQDITSGLTAEDYQRYLRQAFHYVNSLKTGELALLQLQIQGQQLMNQQQLSVAEASLPPQAYSVLFQQQETLRAYYQSWKTYFEQLDQQQLQLVRDQFGQQLATYACQSAAAGATAVAAAPVMANDMVQTNFSIPITMNSPITCSPANQMSISGTDLGTSPANFLQSPFLVGSDATSDLQRYSRLSIHGSSSTASTIRLQGLRNKEKETSITTNWFGKAANTALSAISVFNNGGSATANGAALGNGANFASTRSTPHTRTFSPAGSAMSTSVFSSGKETISRTEGRAFGYQQILFRRDNATRDDGAMQYPAIKFVEAPAINNDQLSAPVLHDFLKKIAVLSLANKGENAAGTAAIPSDKGKAERLSNTSYAHFDVSAYGTEKEKLLATNEADENSKVASPSKKLNIFLPAFLKLEFSKDLRLGKKLAEGGGGIVYQCELLDQDFLRNRKLKPSFRFVFKSVSKLFDPENQKSKRMLESCLHQEVSLMYAFRSHPNCIKLIAWTDEPNYGLLMKQYDMDLTTLIVRRKNEPLPFWRLSSDIACALKDLHYYSITHNDVKSSNIFVELVRLKSSSSSEKVHVPPACIIERNGGKFHYRAVLADFGLAYYWGNDGIKGRQKMLTFGLSLPYAGPELLAAQYMSKDAREKIVQKEFTSKLDVYAFVVIMWEMLERSRAWANVPSGEIQMCVIQGKRPQISSHRLNHPAAALIEQGWQDNAAQRPAMEALYNKLNELASSVSTLYDTT